MVPKMGSCLPRPTRDRDEKYVSGSELLTMVADNRTEELIGLLRNGMGEEWKARILVDAAYYDRLDLVKYLLSTGTDVNSINGQALVMAASRGNCTMVKFLVYMGVDVSVRKGRALLYAVREGHLNVVRYLLTMNSFVESVEDLLQISAGTHRDYGSLNPYPDIYKLLTDTLRPSLIGLTVNGKNMDRLVTFYL